jgi:hypothetical protein
VTSRGRLNPAALVSNTRPRLRHELSKRTVGIVSIKVQPTGQAPGLNVKRCPRFQPSDLQDQKNSTVIPVEPELFAKASAEFDLAGPSDRGSRWAQSRRSWASVARKSRSEIRNISTFTLRVGRSFASWVRTKTCGSGNSSGRISSSVIPLEK